MEITTNILDTAICPILPVPSLILKNAWRGWPAVATSQSGPRMHAVRHLWDRALICNNFCAYFMFEEKFVVDHEVHLFYARILHYC
jgi:hypothetical protein